MPQSREQKREYMRLWRAANRDRRASYMKKWTENNREARRAWARSRYAKNRDAILERQRAKRQPRKRVDPEIILQNARDRRRRWREKNGQMITDIRIHYDANPEVRARRRELKNARRASDSDVQRRDNVKQRLSKAIGIPPSELPQELFEAKLAQVRALHATRVKPT